MEEMLLLTHVFPFFLVYSIFLYKGTTTFRHSISYITLVILHPGDVQFAQSHMSPHTDIYRLTLINTPIQQSNPTSAPR